jgi:ppGpp synthetase/RelA/SpoT-type nucleotidyltranferase
MPASPWSSKKLRRLGECLRDELPLPDDVPSYHEVMLWYNELATQVQATLQALPWETVLGERRPEITARPKTIDTLTQKLRRDRSTPLPSVQDIAGVRVEAEMNLTEQDQAVTMIAGIFAGHRSEIHDLRGGEHSGYRAVHVWLWLDAGRVEIQIRTHIQGAWANAYEAAGDRFGREIRYGEFPTNEETRRVVEELQTASSPWGIELEKLRTQLDAVEQRMLQRLPPSWPASSYPEELRQLKHRLQEAEEHYQKLMKTIRESLIS